MPVGGRHLFSGKARHENKGDAAPHQNIRDGIGVMSVDAHVEQRSVESLAPDRLERALQGGDRTHDGPSAFSEDRLDQSGNHRLVFDDEHPPARPTRGFPLPGSALWATSRFGLAGGPKRKVGMAMPSTTPSTVCYCESSDILKLTRSPLSSNSIFAFPPRPWLTSRSIKLRPKPCRGGLPTVGPPRSTQSNTRLVPLRLSTAQEISSDPPAADREPYFTELVPSSWMIMPSESASFGLSETPGPSMTMRSSRPVRYGSTSWRTTSARDTSPHWSRETSS